MVEQAKLAYLQEGIKKAKRSERSGTAISISGLMIVILSVLFPQIIKTMPSPSYYVPFFFGLFGGLLVIVLGMAFGIHYAIQGGVLMEQLKRMASKCSIN
ncbi:MAG: hypothetical protein ACXV2C_03245 [Candidatus Bathyarchaeia archaeon]